MEIVAHTSTDDKKNLEDLDLSRSEHDIVAMFLAPLQIFPLPRFLLLAVCKSGRAWYLFSHKHGIMDDSQTNPERESWTSRLLLYIRVTKWVYYLSCLINFFGD